MIPRMATFFFSQYQRFALKAVGGVLVLGGIGAVFYRNKVTLFNVERAEILGRARNLALVQHNGVQAESVIRLYQILQDSSSGVLSRLSDDAALASANFQLGIQAQLNQSQIQKEQAVEQAEKQRAQAEVQAREQKEAVVAQAKAVEVQAREQKEAVVAQAKAVEVQANEQKEGVVAQAKAVEVQAVQQAKAVEVVAWATVAAVAVYCVKDPLSTIAIRLASGK
jgi:hypothetical protein